MDKVGEVLYMVGAHESSFSNEILDAEPSTQRLLHSKSYDSFNNNIKSLQHLTVLPMKFFHRRKTHIPSIINLPTKSPIEMLRQ